LKSPDRFGRLLRLICV